MNLAPRSTFQDRYVIDELIGEGGTGHVYSATDLILQRKVCIKILKADLLHEEKHRQRFLHEGKVLATLQHENIVRCFQLGLVDGRIPFLVMEWIDGPSLRQHCNDLQSGWQECLQLALPICDALSFAHETNLSHRDLKPENVLLASHEQGTRVKVIDFGIAKWFSASASGAATKTTTLIGSPRYMSPEQCQADANIDCRSDIYSLGCILYELISGKPPFDGASPILIISKQCSARHSNIKFDRTGQKVPPVVNAILSKCLEKSADARYKTAAETKVALITALNEAPSGSCRDQRAKRHFPLIASASVVIAAALLSAGALRNGSVQIHTCDWVKSSPFAPRTASQFRSWKNLSEKMGATTAATIWHTGEILCSTNALYQANEGVALLQDGTFDSPVFEVVIQALKKDTDQVLSDAELSRREDLIRTLINMVVRQNQIRSSHLMLITGLDGAYDSPDKPLRQRLVAKEFLLRALQKTKDTARLETVRCTMMQLLVASGRKEEARKSLFEGLANLNAVSRVDATAKQAILLQFARITYDLGLNDKAEEVARVYSNSCSLPLDRARWLTLLAEIVAHRDENESRQLYQRAFGEDKICSWQAYAGFLCGRHDTKKLTEVLKIVRPDLDADPEFHFHRSQFCHSVGLEDESLEAADTGLSRWRKAQNTQDIKQHGLNQNVILAANSIIENTTDVRLLHNIQQSLLLLESDTTHHELLRLTLLGTISQRLGAKQAALGYYAKALQQEKIPRILSSSVAPQALLNYVAAYSRYLQELDRGTQLHELSKNLQEACRGIRSDKVLRLLTQVAANYRTLEMPDQEIDCRNQIIEYAALNPTEQNAQALTIARLYLVETEIIYHNLPAAEKLLQEWTPKANSKDVHTCWRNELKLRLQTVTDNSPSIIQAKYAEFRKNDHVTPQQILWIEPDCFFDCALACHRAGDPRGYREFLEKSARGYLGYERTPGRGYQSSTGLCLRLLREAQKREAPQQTKRNEFGDQFPA